MNTRLSSVELDILARISLHADKSVVELARIAGRKVHTVRYLLQKLRSLNAIRTVWIVDLFKLGWQRYSILFSLQSGDEEKIKKFIRTKKNIIHFGDAAGAYDYICAIVARNSSEVLELLEDACAVCGLTFSAKRISVQNQMSYFSSKSLVQGAFDSGSISIGGGPATEELSTLEHRLLETLMKYPESSHEDLARLLDVSTPTVFERMRSLKKRGIIVGARFSYKSEAFSTQKFKMLITIARHDAKMRKAFMEFLRKVSVCTSVRSGIGDWDLELNLEAPTRKEVIAAKRSLWKHFPDYVAAIELLPTFGTYRYVSYPALL